jgi:hypothetical protein
VPKHETFFASLDKRQLYKGLESRRIPAMQPNPWGTARELLIKMAELDPNDAAQQHLLPRA